LRDAGAPLDSVPGGSVFSVRSWWSHREALPGVSEQASALDRPVLERLRALVLARQLVDEQIAALVSECWDRGISRYTLAALLGVSRSNLYRRRPRGSQGPP
jgi:hypothetical protein